mmetsp:Transcript_2171/g.7304  ORF Transcript_2171/g.7304 Transcript_2171/m.7304 type:complete len:191 (+) Transcript_2171:92-664(+)
MFLTWAVSLFGGVVAVVLLTVSVACGLFLAAEFAEEHVTLTGKLLRSALKVVLALHVVLLVDGTLPAWAVAVGIGCHCCYAVLVADFPHIDATSPAALCSLVALLVDHVAWFRSLKGDLGPLNTIGFFLLYIWLVPVGCILCFSVNDLALPIGRVDETARSTSLLKAALESAAALIRTRLNYAYDHQKGY